MIYPVTPSTPFLLSSASCLLRAHISRAPSLISETLIRSFAHYLYLLAPDGDFPSFGGAGPDPDLIAKQGIEYLKKGFPQMDYIKFCRGELQVQDLDAI